MGKLNYVLTKTIASFDGVAPPEKQQQHQYIDEKTAKTSCQRGFGVVCIGVSCLDIELCNTCKGEREDKIPLFTETKYVPGGSCPQVATALAEMGVDGVIAVTKLGKDANGDELVCVCVCVLDCLFFKGFQSHVMYDDLSQFVSTFCRVRS